MKRFSMGLVTGLMMTALVSSYAAAEEEKPAGSAAMGVFSKYIWRGYELSHGAVVEPSVSAGYKGFSMNLWGNLDTDFDDRNTGTKDGKKWTETDLTLEYARKFGPVKLGLGYIYYALNAVDDSEEVYLGAALDVFLTPTITVYREIAHAPQWYARFGLGHSIPLPKGMSLDFAGSVAYSYSDDAAFTKENSTEKYRAFHDGNLSVGLRIPLGKYVVINPLLAYSFPLSDTAREHLRASSFSGESDFLYGGVNAILSF